MAVMAASNPVGQILLGKELENPFTKGFFGMRHKEKSLGEVNLKLYHLATRYCNNCYIFFTLKKAG